MQTNLSTSLISTIQERELSINSIKTELIKQWIIQGEDLLKLQVQQQCSQNELTNLTGVSKGAVYNYIHISKDRRLSEWLQGDHHGGQLENFNQKQLLQLTKLDDSAFETALQEGAIAATPKEKSTVESSLTETGGDDEAIDVDISEEPLNVEGNNFLSELVDIACAPYKMGHKTCRPQIAVNVDDESVKRLKRLKEALSANNGEIVAQALILMERMLEFDDVHRETKAGQ